MDALQQWREHMGLSRMVLVGHSLGGYIAATYALRHPEHVQHLVLVCPAGVVRSPLRRPPPFAPSDLPPIHRIHVQHVVLVCPCRWTPSLWTTIAPAFGAFTALKVSFVSFCDRYALCDHIDDILPLKGVAHGST